MNLAQDLRQACGQYLSRRGFLGDGGVGVAGIAASAPLANDGAGGAPATANPLVPRPALFPARARRVIYMFQAGAPSHLELFDYKPELTKRSGQLPPAELLKNYRAAFIKPNSALLGSKYKFARHGQSGMYLSEVLPYHAQVVDELCFIR